MALKTSLYDTHIRESAKIIDFGGWDMPLHYGSQLEEHHAVRRDAGMFDVSHMCVIDLGGERARDLLRRLLANDVARLDVPGKALYSCMLLPSGGVLDDLIVYFLSGTAYRMVVNAGTRHKDLTWIRRHAADFDVHVAERSDLGIIAIQGPNARVRTAALLGGAQRAAALSIPAFSGAQFDSWFLSRTGYTGEDGFELVLPIEQCPGVWEALRKEAIRPAGLGARDTLRLEAGMSLYGNDLDERHHPLESGLTWTVALQPKDRDFIGRQALESARQEPGLELVGLVLEGRGVLRSHQSVSVEGATGEVTSGTFSPTLSRSIALARIPRTLQPQVQVEIRGKLHTALIVRPPFVRHGKALIPIKPEELIP